MAASRFACSVGRILGQLSRNGSLAGPRAGDIWARSLQSSRRLNGGTYLKLCYSTGLSSQENPDLQTKLNDLEKKLDIVTSNEDMRKLEGTLQEHMSAVSASLKDLKEELKKLEMKLDNVSESKDIMVDRENTIREAVQEITKRNRRHLCVQVTDFPISTADTDGARRRDNIRRVNESLAQDFNIDVKVRDVFHLKKSKATIIEFHNAHDKTLFMNNISVGAKRNEKLWKTVRPFLTKMQWEDKKEELNKLYAQAAKDGLDILYTMDVFGRFYKRQKYVPGSNQNPAE